jgi:uncharacterized protein with GYD domain
MPTFILMTKMSPQFAQDPRGRKKAGKDWMREVASKCPGLRWVAHYAMFGRFDFMDIYEAPDLETAQKVSYLSIQSGAATAESWPALPYERFLELAEEVEI